MLRFPIKVESSQAPDGNSFVAMIIEVRGEGLLQCGNDIGEFLGQIIGREFGPECNGETIPEGNNGPLVAGPSDCVDLDCGFNCEIFGFECVSSFH